MTQCGLSHQESCVSTILHHNHSQSLPNFYEDCEKRIIYIYKQSITTITERNYRTWLYEESDKSTSEIKKAVMNSGFQSCRASSSSGTLYHHGQLPKNLENPCYAFLSNLKAVKERHSLFFCLLHKILQTFLFLFCYFCMKLAVHSFSYTEDINHSLSHVWFSNVAEVTQSFN